MDQIVVVHADLGMVEPGVRELAAEHAAHYGPQFEVVQHDRSNLVKHVEDAAYGPRRTTAGVPRTSSVVRSAS
ncbi:hypothetical protein ACFVHB_28615 [Kitasatospora sp. NPDC127111]|uniref:hypothetical protein n=1 Tax=Kitasatospora sp. NPDC127111 TaxID=3345363 RepID=UPI00362A37DA